MLPKNKRLNLKNDFKWVASGEKIETSSLKIFLKYSNNNQPLVGIAISGQLFKKAHLRNKYRRIISSVVEKVYNDLKQNINLVILPKESIKKTNKDELLSEFKNISYIYKNN